MVNYAKNIEINQKLKALYQEYNDAFLKLWMEINNTQTPNRINVFGIVNPEKYDTDNGTLVICRETNAWSEESLNNGETMLPWLRTLSEAGPTIVGGKVQRHPHIWYNIGRWLLYIQNKETSIKTSFDDKDEALKALGTMAFTNINKVDGKSSCGKNYYKLISEGLVIELLLKEIEIIKPKYIILCDKRFAKLLSPDYLDSIGFSDYAALKDCIDNQRFATTLHPAARCSNVKTMRSLVENFNN